MSLWLARALDPDLHDGPGLSRLNRLILWMIAASILLGVLETEPLLNDAYGALFAVAERLLLLCFTVEYALRLVVARHNPAFGAGRGNALRYALSLPALIDLAVIVLIVLPFLGLESTLLRVLRALRILRMARLGRYSRAVRLLGQAVASRGPELVVSMVFASGLLLVSSACLYVIEGGNQPDEFGSIPRAMWWSVATLTTVGYGDAVPMTLAGRVFAGLTALVGVGIIAVPTGLMAGAFAEAFQQARDQRKQATANTSTVQAVECQTTTGADGNDSAPT